MLARALLIAALVWTVGCERARNLIDFKGPEKALVAFMDARIEGGAARAYPHLASSDRRVMSAAEWRADSRVQIALSGRSYRIISLERSGATARATVEITQPGGSTTQERWSLIREADGWKIFLDAERQALVKSLLLTAIEEHKNREWRDALWTYAQVLKLDSENVAALEGAESARRELIAWEEKQAYMKKITIFALKARRYDTFGGELPGVRFKLKNEGDRALKRVAVTVSFEDESAAVLARKNCNAVFVHATSTGPYGKPLEPGQEWGHPSDRFCSAKSVPANWLEGEASARVSDLEFE